MVRERGVEADRGEFMAKAELDMVDAMRHTTFHVKIKRGTELRWRIWFATKLILLAAVVMNCNIDVEGFGDD